MPNGFRDLMGEDEEESLTSTEKFDLALVETFFDEILFAIGTPVKIRLGTKNKDLSESSD